MEKTLSESKDKPKILTESIKILPAGRGRVLIISEKRHKKKPKSKTDPKFLHFSLKSNPDNISLIEYLDKDNVKRLYLFPEGRQLSYNDRLELIASLMVTLPFFSSGNNTSSILDKRNQTNVAPFRHFPHFYKAELKVLVKKKWRKYERWRRRN